MVESHIDIEPTHGENRLIRIFLSAIGHGQKPGPTKVRRSCDHHVAPLVLQPGSIERLPVRRVNHNLRIELAGRRGQERLWRLPSKAIIAAYQ